MLALVAAVVAILILLPAKALAYEGIYCHEVRSYPGESCQSNEVSDIARAVGRSNSGYTEVAIHINGGEIRAAECLEDGCEVGTAVVPAGTGKGRIENIGGTRNIYYGYLYNH